MKAFPEKVPMKRRWIRIEVSWNPDCADDLSAEIAQAFAVGVEITGTGVCFYLQEDNVLDDWREMLERVLNGFKETWPIDATPTYSFSSFAEDDWLEKWKVNFKPLRVGKHWIIAPTWEEVHPGPDDRVIRIDPDGLSGLGTTKPPGCAWNGWKGGRKFGRMVPQGHFWMSVQAQASSLLPEHCWGLIK